MKVLGTLTDNLDYYIPSRLDEGYGLHRESIDRIAENGGEFIVTVDCGSVSCDETAYAHSLGIQTLVTDHHNVSGAQSFYLSEKDVNPVFGVGLGEDNNISVEDFDIMYNSLKNANTLNILTKKTKQK